MTIEQAKTIITDTPPLKQDYVNGDEYTIAQENYDSQLVEALRTLVGAFQVNQDVHSEADPIFKGRRYPKTELSVETKMIPYVDIDESEELTRDEAYFSKADLLSWLGLGGYGGVRVVIGAINVSTEFSGQFERTVTIPNTPAWADESAWNFSTLRCYYLDGDYEKEVKPYAIKRSGTSFRIVVPKPCTIYYNVQEINK